MLPAEQQVLADLAGRLDAQDGRVERLETLEFSTTAFPSAGGFTPICHAVTTISSSTLDACPVPFPTTFLHLYGVIRMLITIPTATDVNKVELNFNLDFGSVYQHYQRQEVPFAGPVGSADRETGTIAPATDTKILIQLPSGDNEITEEQVSTLWFVIPAYVRTDNDKSMAWFGFTFPRGNELSNIMEDCQGGGDYFPAVSAPITSMRITLPPPGLFIGSGHTSITVYGM